MRPGTSECVRHAVASAEPLETVDVQKMSSIFGGAAASPVGEGEAASSGSSVFSRSSEATPSAPCS